MSPEFNEGDPMNHADFQANFNFARAMVEKDRGFQIGDAEDIEADIANA